MDYFKEIVKVDPVNHYLVFTKDRLLKLKENINSEDIKQLEIDLSYLLRKPYYTVTSKDKNICFGINNHNYISLATYYWPNPETYLLTWKSMERLYKDGLVKAIGVCNFHQYHLESLMEVADIMPMVNQVELHPLLSQRELVNFCKDNGILVEAYSPLARNNPQLMKNDVLIELGKKYSKSVAQVILRWDYQNHIVSVPKSENPERMRNNISIFDFELTESEMLKIDALNKNMRVRHDPDNCDFSKL